jgi:periplasmic protein TonB
MLGWLERFRLESLGAKVAVSTLLHVLVLVVVSYGWWGWARARARVGTVRGSHAVLLYLPGERSASTPERQRYVKTQKGTAKAAVFELASVEAAVASAAAPVVEHEDGTAGNDALGTEIASIRLITAFPARMPDLSGLQAGASWDLVIEVLIDSNGRVANAKTKKGVGHDIDEMVVATVEQWLFQPVTKDGRPVRSEQELHFHYQRGCDPMRGWGCFELAP